MMGKRLDNKEQATEVIRLAGLALRHFEVWRVYTDQTSLDRLFPAMRHFPDFVRLDEHAHRELFLLYLGCLFETNGNTINLAGLIEAAAKASDRFDKERVSGSLKEADEMIRKIAMVRGGAVAHRGISISRKDLFEKAGLKPDDLRVLVDDAEQIAYAIGRAFGIAPFTVSVLATVELDAIYTRLLPDAGAEGGTTGSYEAKNTRG
ncbi:hypothetical protein [Caulobacter segnis]|uniref:AbiU2 domain-containing protein n=1 Tax=Caulobacter segnis TaxID=88688 RepID=UPI00285BF7D6|nr:hypothetical protein [Caulobacter segnis]MDR6627611.1 hypothetical protein [Caulobacter segnis]